ncbi:MAG: hypothetical protein ABR512_14940 [Desulfopila sp.]
MLQYIYACMRHRALPWNFFQLNSRYFSEYKGIFSKLEMDDLVPSQWRLEQYHYDKKVVPRTFPVFIKPEWGQNSAGIVRVDTEKQYRDVRRQICKNGIPFIVQQAAPGEEEYEIYYLRSPSVHGDFASLFITQVKNRSGTRHPINSIHNPDTGYIDITATLSSRELVKIWQYLEGIGDFRMARVCVKADSKNDLIQGEFHIVEMNVFLPMPLVLLAQNIDYDQKRHLVREMMTIAAQLVKTVPAEYTGKSIFFRKMKAHYGMKR